MPHPPPPHYQIQRLDWTDPDLGSIDMPKGKLELRAGFGSGLTRRQSDPPGTLWAVCDRGPNLKLKDAAELYGLDWCRDYDGPKDAKIMPRLDLGPAIAELRVAGDGVELIRTLSLTGKGAEPICGLPIPTGGHAECEPALDLEGNRLEPDPDGADTEGIAARPDGGFWLGEEYGPSLIKVDAEGRVQLRLVPEGVELRNAACPVKAVLPALAAKRKLNRGFEAVSLSADGKWLFLAFQSPLAHPDNKGHENGRHVRIWLLDAETGEAAAQYLYPLDPSQTFRRDVAKEDVKLCDVKVSEILHIGEDTLLVLERISATTKLYRVKLSSGCALPQEHFTLEARPTVEELSAGEHMPLPVLAKVLIFNSDNHPEFDDDMEGMALLSPSELVMVTDNDFGVTGGRTGFWRLRFDAPLA
ncbi:MAG TPA: esterase-like activity of phytase family protein [Allosphingosinicella sp.]|uniref:esterase-like activity of phytase family protein n=1 Tax=Allosphingosinicella sp. TaxID=2823234 RepID=UPI002ED77930